MIRLFFLALAAVLIVSVGYIVIPRNTIRPDPGLASPAAATAPDPGAFVVHDAPPATAPIPPVPNPAAVPAGASVGRPAPAPPAAASPNPPSTPDLDALMQRLRAASADPASPPPPAQAPLPALPPAPAPVPPAAAPIPAVITPATPPPASRWTNVTGQGARWRLTPSASGYTVAIDLGGGRVAEVRVAPAFANLDSAAVNQRVDYLKQTILQNFPPESATYTFARDGSVSLDH